MKFSKFVHVYCPDYRRISWKFVQVRVEKLENYVVYERSLSWIFSIKLESIAQPNINNLLISSFAVKNT